MTQYVALLRGIGPTNPNMRNSKICEVFEQMKLENVRAVLSTGNILFETARRDTAAMARDIEQAIASKLGFHSTVIIRSRQQLSGLAMRRPFGDMVHSKQTNLNITFLKHATKSDLQLPYNNPDGTYTILAQYDNEVASVVDITGAKIPNLMARLEKAFGPDITTRSWNTVQKIIKKWEA